MTIAIYGPGGFGRQLIATNSGRTSEGRIFISDDPREIGATIEGARVYSLEEAVALEAASAAAHARQTPDTYPHPPSPYRPISVVIAVGSHEVRRRLADKVTASGLAVGHVHAPTSIVGPSVTLGEGSILCDFTMIEASTKIGRHFQANKYSNVAHDCIVGDFVTLAPRVCVNGNTIVEDDVYIGTGAMLKQGTTDKPRRIGRGAVIGMGAVVTKDVPAGAVMVGNPARPMSVDSSGPRAI